MKYPVGIQNFEKLRRGGYVYIDKTELVYKLATTGCYYFLSRPRRFGKSLLISTMEAYFSGKKELFEGLAIEKLEQDWIEYPILHLDLNSRNYVDAESLNLELIKHLKMWEAEYGDEYKDTKLEERFYHIIRLAAEKTGRQVVILVDEYDKPLLQAIGKDDLQAEYRSILKAFYSVLKTQDKYIQFAFLTGVTKFGKVSIFSDLNNLEDLSMLQAYTDLCGVSEVELYKYFDESIKELAEANIMTFEEACAKLKKRYDGYHFCENSVGIYNPFSLLNTFKSGQFRDYWFETGTPTFIVELLKRTDYDLNKLTTEGCSTDRLNSIDSMATDPVPVIYQSGYLTVKDYDERFKYYTLGFPNDEVETGFIKFLLPFYTSNDGSQQSEFYVNKFVHDVEQGDAQGFMERMSAFFADSVYQVMGDLEKYFQNTMYVIFKLMGFYAQVERHTYRGRIDVTIATKDYIYIIEIKRDGSVDSALEQIEKSGYAKPFAMDSRKLYRIGVNFSTTEKCITDFKIV